MCSSNSFVRQSSASSSPLLACFLVSVGIEMSESATSQDSKTKQDVGPGGTSTEDRNWADASEHLATNEVEGIDYDEEVKTAPEVADHTANQAEEDVSMAEPPTEENFKK